MATISNTRAKTRRKVKVNKPTLSAQQQHQTKATTIIVATTSRATKVERVTMVAAHNNQLLYAPSAAKITDW